MTKFNLTYYHPSHFRNHEVNGSLRLLLLFAYSGVFVFLGVVLAHFLSHPIFT